MTDNAPKQWHREVISDSTRATLDALRSKGVLDRFYLAGGTGLALHFGHRLSQDLDFFAAELFDEESLLQDVQVLEGFSLVAKDHRTLHVTVQGTKVSFLGYVYPLLFPLTAFMRVPVAEPRDIACMKISAIATRGTKRDFVDLFTCARQSDLDDLVRSFERKYAQAKYNRLHVLKSLAYFDDAEKDPMPHMLIPLDWKEVKKFFLREVPRLL